MIDIEEYADNEVHHYMTAQAVTVSPTAPIGELAQKMVDAHHLSVDDLLTRYSRKLKDMK